MIESYPDGVSRQLDTSNPEFGARSAVPAENRGAAEGKHNEGKSNENAKSLNRAGTQTAEGLPSLTGSPGVTREPTETGFSPSGRRKKSPKRSLSARSSEDDEDEDDSDHGNADNVKVSMSIANLASAMSGSKSSANTDAMLQLIDLDAVQVSLQAFRSLLLRCWWRCLQWASNLIRQACVLVSVGHSAVARVGM